MSALLTGLWYTNNVQASRELLDQNKNSIEACEGACGTSIDKLASRLHAVLGESEERAIRKLISEPLMVLQNTALIDPPTEAGNGAMDTVMRTMFWQLSKAFMNVEGIFYVGTESDYVKYLEYERVSHRPGDHSAAEPAFTLEFDVGPKVNQSFLRASCPRLCPPAKELVPWHRHIYAVSNDTGAAEHLLDHFPEDVTKQAWYLHLLRVMRAGGKVLWDGPRNWKGTVRLRIARPLVRDGQIKFVVGADITLAYLTRFLQSMDLGANGVVFIVDGEGHVISSWPPLGQMELSDHGLEQELPHWQTLRNPLLRAVMSDLVQRPGCSTGVRELKFRSGYLYSAKQIECEKKDFELKWTFVNVQPLHFYKGSSLRALEHQQRTTQEAQEMLAGKLRRSVLMVFFISGIFLVAEAFVICAVAEAITQPLKGLQDDMRAVTELDFAAMESHVSKPPSLPSAESNEVCELQEVRVVTCPCSAPSGIVKAVPRRRMTCIQEIADIRESFAYMATGLLSFSRYMDPSLVRMLVQSKRQARLGVAKANVTIFFSDIANFTNLAENLDQTLFMNMLGMYLNEMAGIIMANNGIVGEFIGDAIMAWWNAPEDMGEEHTVVALRAALQQQACLKRLREKWVKDTSTFDCLATDGLPQVKARMGLAAGQVLAGNIGSPERMKYGLVGDTVNLASRLESLCKRYQVEILIDDAASKAPGVVDTFLLRPLGLVTVKGRSSVTELFELVGLRQAPVSPSGNDLEAFCDDFKAVQDVYQQGEFECALQMLNSYAQRWPNDKPTQMLRQRCEELVACAPGPAWSPVEWLSEK